MNAETYELTLADQKEADERVKGASGSSGRHEYLRSLQSHPLAMAELGRPRGYDHIHLTQVDGTDIVHWLGRASSGWHRQIGRHMRLVPVAGDPTHD